MERVFSGVQPSGVLHIGNYLGAIKNWLELQNDYQCIFCVVDLHAITVPQEPKELLAKTIEVAKIYLAAGIDPKKSTIFVQSHIKEHAELAWLLNTITRIPELERMTQFKDKIRGQKSEVSMGLFDYPVLMAADILLYKAAKVPVGEDQVQHIELARSLAQRFNGRFSEVFIIPKPMVRKEGARIMGLDDPTKKMAKSANSAYNYIALTDSPDTIREKIKKAMTDSGKEIVSGPDKPALANLLTIHSLLVGQPVVEVEQQYQGKSYAEFKNDLAEVIIGFLEPVQKKYNALDDSEVLKILRAGAKKIQPIATKTMAEVKKVMGIIE
ncbi:tryptophan--tRNA ligase [Patescibacteria group bacterium]|nr:tryptophan--tRNA ligase [Patescibacteria group bacterium]MBU2220177.1 tryptophan--tRNA ligase [Patescibacteria group bacterium]MBU2265293.1 tryptophan--tRNA ligase [Patescibacteria group bacterium]